MTEHEDTAAARTIQSLKDARTAIDAEFGAGFASANPTLVAAYLQANAIQMAIAVGREAAGETNRTLLQLKPKFFG